MIKKLKKVDYFQLKNEKYELNEVLRTLTLSGARTHFLILTNMIRAKTNYMSDPVYSRELYLCDCGDGLLCSTQHYKVCRKYEKFRMNIDWTDNNQVIRYYQKILKLRENEEKTSPSTQT